MFESVSSSEQDAPPPRRATTARNNRVLTKLQKANDQVASVNKDYLQQWANILSSKQLIKDYYMSFTSDMICQTLDDIIQLESHAVPTKQNLSDIDMDFYQGNKDLLDRLFTYATGKTSYVRVCIVLRETQCSSVPAQKKTLKNFLSPMMNGDEQLYRTHSQNVGLFHPAVLVGPYLLEWDPSCSLCIPKLCCGNADEIFASDLGFFSDSSQLASHVFECVTSVIVEWNLTKTYSPDECNFHHFALSIWESIFGSEVTQNVAKYFETQFDNQLTETGQCDLMNFKIPDSISPLFSTEDTHIRFTSHSQINSVVVDLLDFDSDFFALYPNEAMVLKSIDRSFWMREMVDIECNADDHHNCPFGNPSEQGWRVGQKEENDTSIFLNYLIFFRK